MESVGMSVRHDMFWGAVEGDELMDQGNVLNSSLSVRSGLLGNAILERRNNMALLNVMRCAITHQADKRETLGFFQQLGKNAAN